jgi:hypothetical protein
MPITLDGGAGVTYPDGVQQTNAVTNTGGDPRYYAARAWVVFDGTSPVNIISSVGVSSVTRNSTGDYTLTFNPPMPNANYAVIATARGTSSDGPFIFVDGTSAPTTSNVRLQIVNVGYPAGTASSSTYDSSRVSVAIFA